MSADREAAIRTAVEGAMVGAWGQERALFALDELLADFGEKSERLDAVEAEIAATREQLESVTERLLTETGELAAAREREAKLREALRWLDEYLAAEGKREKFPHTTARKKIAAALADGEGKT